MVKSTINIPERENRILTILKGKYGLSNKEQVIISLIRDAEENLEPEIRPEYVEKIKKIEKGKFISFDSLNDLRKSIENA